MVCIGSDNSMSEAAASSIRERADKLRTRVTKGFGSFHSESVETLISRSDSDYRPPPLPFDVTCKLPDWLSEKGRLNRLFMLDEKWTFINHGAFGASLQPAMEASRSWATHTERQPLKFLDRELLPLLVYAIRCLASFVGANAADLVLLPNATTGLNAIFRSLKFTKDDHILSLNIGYGSVKKMLAETGATLDEAKIDFPTDEKQIVATVAAALHSKTKLFVVDAITSNTALALPLKPLVDLCNSRGVLILIDGAHALGSVPLNLNDLNPSFFVSNAHKWLCTPKTSIRPLVISHGYGSGFTSEFIWTGLRDYGPMLSIITAIDLWNKLGQQRIRSYAHELVLWAAHMLAEKWGTELLAPDSLYATMATVRLPGHRKVQYNEETDDIQDILHFQYNIEVPIKLVQDSLYVRISAHLYNTREEYERLAAAILDIRPKIDAALDDGKGAEGCEEACERRDPKAKAKTTV